MFRLTPFVVIALALVGTPTHLYAQDDEETTEAGAEFDDLKLRFNRLVREARNVISDHGVQAGIDFYNDALLEPENEGYGQIHLRLANLHKQLERTTEAAYHYRECHRDSRVDQVDREVICWNGYLGTTSTLTIRGLPEGARVVIISPSSFAGPYEMGDRLPKGRVDLMVEAPGRMARGSTLNLERNLVWEAMLGLPHQEGPLIPEGFVSEDDEPGVAIEDPIPMPEKRSSSRRWPAVLTAGVGAVLLGTGIGMGALNSTELKNLKNERVRGLCPGIDFCNPRLAELKQTATTADALWIAGAVLQAGAIALWLTGDDEEAGP